MAITINQALRQAIRALSNSPSAQLDAEVLLSHCINKSRSQLIAWPEKTLSETEESQFEQLLQKRIPGQPIAYLLGQREFWSINFKVNEHTLIPRPETELLVETALKLYPEDNPLHAIDLGTGSGCIAIALGHERRNWKLLASDKSEQALTIAKTNATNLNIHNIEFILSDWFNDIPNRQFDFIVSNPPYVPDNDPHLEQGDVRFEPRSALASGHDGMNDIHQLFNQAQRFLKPGGRLLLEIGHDQADSVRTAAHSAACGNIEFVLDFANIKRVCIAQWL